MHRLNTTSTSLDEIVEPVDLEQPPGDVVVLSFADSDLSALAAAWALEQHALSSVRLVHLRDLRHPMSVDLWIERVATRAKVILVRLIGGLDWWRYGVEQLSAVARTHDIKLALLPGEDRDDPRLAEASTLPPEELDTLLRFFREGGRENLRALLRRLGRHAGAGLDLVHLDFAEPTPLPRLAGYLPDLGAIDIDRLAASVPPGRPVVPIIFYRALLLAGDTGAIDALCEALSTRGLAPAPLAITSLKESAAAAFVRDALAWLRPAVVVTTTAFAASGDGGDPTPLDGPDVPVLQAVIATTRRAAWRESSRGLGAADLAMHVVLPELDGRVLAGAIAFKDSLPPHAELAFTSLASRPEPDRVAAVADRVAALVRLREKPRAERRVAVAMPDYPGAPGRTGYAVGLDVPASVVALLGDLAAAGYDVRNAPQTSGALLDALLKDCTASSPSLLLADYTQLLAGLPAELATHIHDAWGDPADDPDARYGAFRFRASFCGNVIVALPPDRGRASERRGDYHDPALPPRHALVAFWLWLRHVFQADALVHMGAHGTLEWLPGKAVALTATCFPEAIIGALPVFYPFIVSNPGEAAQAKRRIAAVTIGHLPPPLVAADLSGDARRLERLVDEYAQADGLDRRRRERLAVLIVEGAHETGLGREAGVDANADADEVLRRIDAWLCDLKDLSIKDGLHVYGRPPMAPDADPAWQMSAAAEREALLAALDGRRVPPGPAGAPMRGRRDVLPTGRNLFVADPRMLPTPTAMEFGQRAAAEVIRCYLQAHGEMPRALVIDLWGSATLRTGGEEIAQGLSLMGCRPTWDPATGRVTGIEVLPPAAMGRPRVDVTWRISGLFRDLFPAQIALIDAAVRAIAAREETADENPLAAACRPLPVPPSPPPYPPPHAGEGQGGGAEEGRVRAPARIFGTAPGAYGAGVEDLIGREADRSAVGAAYLASASHAYGGPEGGAVPMLDAFAERIASADVLVHPGDDPGRDLLEGAEDVAFVGGFAAAAAALGRAPDLIMLDVTDPQRPRARPLDAALARIVRARVRAFLLRENPGAARAIAARLGAARRHGWWHPRRNDIDADLAAVMAETAP